MPPRLVWLVPAVMLLLAVAELPYGYYTLLRLVVCLSCVVILYQAHIVQERSMSAWPVALIGMALLFNPLIRVHLSREVWAPIDIACAVILLAHMLIERDRKWQIRSTTGTRAS